MPPDPALVEEARAWLVKAAGDLRAARLALDADPPLLDHAVFDAQQAAEKSIKGFLVWHGEIFGKTHVIEKIGEQALGIDKSLGPLIDSAAPLSEYAWRFRYPGDPETPSRSEAEGALEIARDLHEAVITRLPSEVRPDSSELL
ncbi:MAG: HEPN domain-containing protein [Gemmatimonadota bacterium]